MRSERGALDEAVGLAAAISIEVVEAEIIRLAQRRPATLFGTGKVDEIKARLEAAGDIGLVIVNGTLTPVQHRNLEKAWNAKVLDRTALILEIFGERAQTREGVLQVALAHLTYQRSRLVRSWTHLERQRGGAGFLGGPGERQIEADRRVLAGKIDRLKAQLEEVRRTRTLQRAKRSKAPQPVVALVGYTNAGKSTLFNRLTGAEVMSADLLFATLDPTMRKVDLPSGTRVILSDTVGFISDLPTTLVAAFRATLEEVLEADVILHVRDVAHEETDAQRADVLSVLGELGVHDEDGRRVIEVWNKADLLPSADRDVLSSTARTRADDARGTLEDPIPVLASALTGEGLDTLFAEIERLLTAEHRTRSVALPPGEGAALSWLHERTDVVSAETTDDGGVVVTVRLGAKESGQFQERFGYAFATAEEAHRGRKRA
nr:GTPase HflX [Parvularcula dongshanensis]